MWGESVLFYQIIRMVFEWWHDKRTSLCQYMFVCVFHSPVRLSFPGGQSICCGHPGCSVQWCSLQDCFVSFCNSSVFFSYPCPDRSSADRVRCGLTARATAFKSHENSVFVGNLQPFVGAAIGRPARIERIPGAHCAPLHKTAANRAIVV